MLDLSHIPSQQQQTYTFYATGNWQTWNKPRNAKMIEIFCLGAGGAGGSGGANVASRAGGGGGGSAGITRALFPAFLLPDTLYVQPGKGGPLNPGTTTTAGNTGATGSISYVAIAPTTSATTVLVQSSAAAAGGGLAAATNGTNAGGAAATIWTITSSPFTTLGLVTAIAGVAGGSSANGLSAAVTNIQALGSTLVTGGAGGGASNNTSLVGGSILSASAILTSTVNAGSRSVSPGNGIPGGSGYGSLAPVCGTGGAGGSGASGSNITGGSGGDGWYGCGGGGGGIAYPAATNIGGNGGRGGDGLVIITVIT
jgi:hypothetical protein